VHALIGLGNPGAEYDGTRHNLGFRVIDAISELLNVRLTSKGEYLLGAVMIGEIRTLLVKPLTYMNNSGSAIIEVTQYYKVRPADMLVICDDFQLPLGSLRLRPKGSDGGHNGLRSVIYHLRSEEFPRLRCGIAGATMPRRKSELTRFVLSEFDDSEKPAVDQMVRKARDAAITFVAEGLTVAMNKYNTPTERSRQTTVP
jgi:PTH1 family peptidyl-tRNA hydrolase